jgi:hypothetical protein
MKPTTELNSVEDRLEQGFRLHLSRLKTEENSPALPLQQIRDFGRVHGTTAEWHQQWDLQWAEVSATLARMETLFGEMDAALEGTAPEYRIKASAAWAQVQAEDKRLVASVNTVCGLAQMLDPLLRLELNLLARNMEVLLELRMLCAQTLFIRLSLLQAPDVAETRRLVQAVFAQCPGTPVANDLEITNYFVSYQKAINDLASHQSEMLGFLDSIKALFMCERNSDVHTGAVAIPLIEPL